jgi:YHS domain-containing protein
MEVDERTAKFKTEYQGKTYNFCYPRCKKHFEQNPEKFLK